jgi:hypothetical protein
MQYFILKNTALIILCCAGLIGISQRHAVLASTNHVVISELQIAGNTANDEFVELYNPTDVSIPLDGWRLAKKTSAETSAPYSLVSKLAGLIAPKSFFLIAHPSYIGDTTPDMLYSATSSGIAANNTVLLYSDNGQTLVDKVGMGTAQDAETATAPLPEEKQSLERKASVQSTQQSMQNTGIDEHAGNEYDTDNNGNDFILRIIPQPQNSHNAQESQSPIVLLPTSSPTIIPISTPTPTAILLTPTPSLPAPTPSRTPTPLPTSTSDPTSPPSPIPSPSLIPAITIIPTPTETIKTFTTSGLSSKPEEPFEFISVNSTVPVQTPLQKKEKSTVLGTSQKQSFFLYKKLTCFYSPVFFWTPLGTITLPFIHCNII